MGLWFKEKLECCLFLTSGMKNRTFQLEGRSSAYMEESTIKKGGFDFLNEKQRARWDLQEF